MRLRLLEDATLSGLKHTSFISHGFDSFPGGIEDATLSGLKLAIL